MRGNFFPCTFQRANFFSGKAAFQRFSTCDFYSNLDKQ